MFATRHHGRHCGGGEDTVVAETSPMAAELLSLCPSYQCQMPLDELWWGFRRQAETLQVEHAQALTHGVRTLSCTQSCSLRLCYRAPSTQLHLSPTTGISQPCLHLSWVSTQALSFPWPFLDLATFSSQLAVTSSRQPSLCSHLPMLLSILPSYKPCGNFLICPICALSILYP